MINYILGVDPGLRGALALYCLRTQKIVEIVDMPINDDGVDPVALHQELRYLWSLDVMALVEDVHSRPRQAGAFAFGFYTGIVHGVLAAVGIPILKVAPSQWKPAMGLRCGRDEKPADTKDRARALAQQMFPDVAKSFARKKDDGRAEAALIAAYGAARGIDSFKRRNQKRK